MKTSRQSFDGQVIALLLGNPTASFFIGKISEV